MALYTEVGGVTATVLPRGTGPIFGTSSQLEGTTLRLQRNEEILYGKMLLQNSSMSRVM